MAKSTRRKIDATLKAKIDLEAMREQASVTDLAQRYGSIHPSIATRLLDGLAGLLSTAAAPRSCMPEQRPNGFVADFLFADLESDV
jgi:hypothetical protein